MSNTAKNQAPLNEPKHTKGRLIAHLYEHHDHEIFSAEFGPDDRQKRIASIPIDHKLGRSGENADNVRRLVDCWNACEGINPEAVPEMLEALRLANSAISTCYDSSEDNRNNPTMQKIGKALDAVQSALSKASEGK